MKAAERYKAQGGSAEVYVIDGDAHLDGCYMWRGREKRSGRSSPNSDFESGWSYLKDAAQVRYLSEHFAQEDAAGGLRRRFKIEGHDDVVREEGWILGV